MISILKRVFLLVALSCMLMPLAMAGYDTSTQSDNRLSANQAATSTTDGDLDTTFGDNGMVTTDIGSGHDLPYAMALQPDGKIVTTERYALNN